MKIRASFPSLVAAICITIVGTHPLAADERDAAVLDLRPEITADTEGPKQRLAKAERDALTGDWQGRRSALEERGFTLKPRVTQFYQGLAAGDGEKHLEYGGKVDLLLSTNLGKLGFWSGLSLVVHGEYNYGEQPNGTGGVVAPVNTALYFPGTEGIDTSDVSSVYFQQRFGDFGSLAVGKINMIDIAAAKPFMGGAGIDSFWNVAFAAPPSGIVPPYLFGALGSLRTDLGTFGLWVYDPTDQTNRTGFEDPFANGITFRGTVEWPVTFAGLAGHQGFVATYSTEPGVADDLNELLVPPFPPGFPGIKDNRYYFAYTFDQYLYQSTVNPKEGFGLFGQVGVSDGNPNRLAWMVLAGLGGTGMLLPGRDRDTWGIGYYYAGISSDLKQVLSPSLELKDEQGIEIFYNFEVTPWFTVGVDLQLIEPALGKDLAVFPGVRSVTRF